VKVLFFARSRELADCSETSLQMPAQLSGQAVWSHIIAHYPRYVVHFTYQPKGITVNLYKLN